MLATLRKHSKSIFIYVLFGLLILTFVLTFGPPSAARRGVRGAQSGCGSASTSAAAVGHDEISEASWRWALMTATSGSPNSNRARASQIRERVLDGLISREILAQKAEELGLRISDDEVRDRLATGEWYLVGTKASGLGRYIVKDTEDAEPHFSARALLSFVQQGGFATIDRFVEEQKRELLAAKMREIISAGVRVSPEEVQSHYELENAKADVDFVLFRGGPAAVRSLPQPTAAEIDKYLADHEAELKAQYDKGADSWKGRDKEVRVRDLYLRSEKPAPTGDADKDKAAAGAPDPAKAKADAALARLKKGEDFGAVVKSVAANTPQAARGGDLGWRPLRGLRLGKPVADAVEKLEKGAMTEVVAVPDGFHIVELIDKREGDLAFDQVKRDFAEDAVAIEKAKSNARAEADKALAAAKAGTPIDKQFPPDTDAKATGPKLQHATGVGRVGNFIQGLGAAPDLVKSVFDEIPVGEMAPKVYEVNGDFVVARLIKRDEPDMQKFQTEKDKIAASMSEQKGQIAAGEYVASQCREAQAQGKISFDPILVEYSDAEGKNPKTMYAPCLTLSAR